MSTGKARDQRLNFRLLGHKNMCEDIKQNGYLSLSTFWSQVTFCFSVLLNVVHLIKYLARPCRLCNWLTAAIKKNSRNCPIQTPDGLSKLLLQANKQPEWKVLDISCKSGSTWSKQVTSANKCKDSVMLSVYIYCNYNG